MEERTEVQQLKREMIRSTKKVESEVAVNLRTLCFEVQQLRRQVNGAQRKLKVW